MSTLTRTCIAIVVAGALAGCAPAINGQRARATKKIIYATIYLTSWNKGDNCSATTVPGRLQVKKNEDVEWSVVDFCGITAGYTRDVSLQNWRVVDGSNCSDGTQVPVDSAATGKLHIRRGIKGGCAVNTVFKYDIYVDTTKLADPELEIAQ